MSSEPKIGIRYTGKHTHNKYEIVYILLGEPTRKVIMRETTHSGHSRDCIESWPLGDYLIPEVTDFEVGKTYRHMKHGTVVEIIANRDGKNIGWYVDQKAPYAMEPHWAKNYEEIPAE